MRRLTLFPGGSDIDFVKHHRVNTELFVRLTCMYICSNGRCKKKIGCKVYMYIHVKMHLDHIAIGCLAYLRCRHLYDDEGCYVHEL